MSSERVRMPAARDPEFRRRAVELARLGDKPVAQVAKHLGISASTLRRWMAQADVYETKRDDPDSFADKDFISGLTTENRQELIEIVKLASAPRLPLLRRSLGTVAGLVVGALFAAFFGGLTGQAKDWLLWHAGHRTLSDSPGCADYGWFRPILPEGSSAIYEYREKSDAFRTYPSANTLDHDRLTAWVGAFSTDTTNNRIGWVFARKRHIAYVCFRTGFRAKTGTYVGNGRPKDAILTACGLQRHVVFPDGTDTVNSSTLKKGFGLNDWFRVPIGCSTATVTLTIASTYDNKNSHLVAISDVFFFTGFKLSEQ